MLGGHCLCGAVRYECGELVSPPTFCHCESCRRASGAHVVAWATVKRSSFRVVHGALRKYRSSERATREFCERCGTPVTYANVDSPDTIDITIASLEAPDAIEPTAHVWMSDALKWDRPQDAHPKFSHSGIAGRDPPDSTS